MARRVHLRGDVGVTMEGLTWKQQPKRTCSRVVCPEKSLGCNDPASQSRDSGGSCTTAATTPAPSSLKRPHLPRRLRLVQPQRAQLAGQVQAGGAAHADQPVAAKLVQVQARVEVEPLNDDGLAILDRLGWVWVGVGVG